MALTLGLITPRSSEAVGSFVTFESGPVRPLALSPDATRLFAANTPDNRLEIFEVGAGGLTHLGSVPVGMEPVALAARTNGEVWVVNHLSDSVSIVDVASSPPRVVRTLLVGDEPRDIVFAGTSGNRAFITTAHRGQHRTHASLAAVPGAGDPQLTTEGIGRADVWVFDATALGNTLGGTPLEILSFFADTPRALAVSPDGNTVYVAAFHSGNQTTTIAEPSVCDGFNPSVPCSVGGETAPGGNPGPSDNVFGASAPETGLIVQLNRSSGQWEDELMRDWSAFVRFDLPDKDVFSINANTLSMGSIQEFAHVGTILFNMAVNPVSGKVYVSNLELPNLTRFEGPGNYGGSTVQGHLSESRITVIDPNASTVDPQHLNQHIDYSKLHTDVPDLVDPNQKNHSLATPVQLAVSSDGATIYLAAFGSAKIGVFSAAAIEDPNFEANFDPTVESASYIATGGGPSGLVLDEARNRLYVLTRFDNSVSVIDLGTNGTVQTVALPNPEPQIVVEGRPFLYDAFNTSGNGEASCSSCHIFGDNDDLAWDLGDPDAPTSTDNQPESPAGGSSTFHPMKGPMTTQTLRGLATHGGMHWRGDRVDGFFGTDLCTESSGAACDEERSFRNFIVAFEGLVGKEGILDPDDMQKFANFALQIVPPPNPVRALDNSLTTAQAAGASLYTGPITDLIATCNGCHVLNPGQGFFGTGGDQSFEAEPQTFKVPHLRNDYTKVGMFGLSATLAGGLGAHTGDQVRGFGVLHDGGIDTLRNFLGAPVFTLSAGQAQDLEQFVFAFDSDLAPIVGQQVTLTATSPASVGSRIDLMVQRAGTAFSSLILGGSVTECDLIVKGTFGGQARGWLLDTGTGEFRSDMASESPLSDAALRLQAATPGQELTYTCAPPGSGQRTGLDRDEDGVFDADDPCPANPSGVCSDVSCGDGVLEGVEECDDGNNVSGDGCSAACEIEFCGDGSCSRPLEDCNSCPGDCGPCPTDCGNGVLDPGEECDDGNLADGDGCSSSCRIEATRDQQRCINELNKGFAKVAKAQGRENARCVKLAGRGRVASAEDCLTADSRGKVAKAKSRNEKGQTRRCTGVTPPFGATDAATGNQVAVSTELDLIHDLFGSDLDAAIIDASDKRADANCQAAVAKLASKCRDAKLKQFNECKARGLDDGSIGDASGLDDCMLTMQLGNLEIYTACFVKPFRKISKKCATTDIAAAFPGECSGAADLTELNFCVNALVVGCNVCRALNQVDGLNRDCVLWFSCESAAFDSIAGDLQVPHVNLLK